VKVKGYEKKIPFIYGIDYETHDIPICLLAPSENYVAMRDFFMKLRNTGYKLRGLVSDDNNAAPLALRHTFQDALVQLCHTHYVENIRRYLCVRTDETYRAFFYELKEIAFSKKLMKRKKLKKALFELFEKYKTDPKTAQVLMTINNRIDELTNHLKIGGCPKTNNLIESYNKQLNGRLKTIQVFESFASAERWLSAWVLQRRLTPFTCCRGGFKKLNGIYAMQKTKKSTIILPDFFN